MLSLAVAGLLSIPGLIVQIITIPIVAVLSVPALALLIVRKPSKPSSDDDQPSNRRIVVTGGSSGIGKCIAIEATKQGYSEVVIIARNKEKLAAVKAELEALNSSVKIQALSVDVSDSKAVKSAAESVLTTSQPPKTTHLFCCAGEPHPAHFETVSSDIFAKLIQTNQLGSIHTAQSFISLMKSGSVTFCSSMAGQVGVFGFASYCPTKFALRGYAECLHVELCNRPIHVQVAYPPDTQTPGYEKENLAKPYETQLTSDAGGLAQPEHVANIMLAKATCSSPPFAVYFSFDGWMLSCLTAGMSPLSTLGDAVSQVAGMALFRWISLFYISNWHRLIKDYQSKKSAPIVKEE